MEAPEPIGASEPVDPLRGLAAAVVGAHGFVAAEGSSQPGCTHGQRGWDGSPSAHVPQQLEGASYPKYIDAVHLQEATYFTKAGARSGAHARAHASLGRAVGAKQSAGKLLLCLRKPSCPQHLLVLGAGDLPSLHAPCSKALCALCYMGVAARSVATFRPRLANSAAGKRPARNSSIVLGGSCFCWAMRLLPEFSLPNLSRVSAIRRAMGMRGQAGLTYAVAHGIALCAANMQECDSIACLCDHALQRALAAGRMRSKARLKRDLSGLGALYFASGHHVANTERWTKLSADSAADSMDTASSTFAITLGNPDRYR